MITVDTGNPSGDTPLPARTLARTGTTLSILGMGTSPLGNLGRETDPDTARAALDAAWESGIRYFDTAPHYGLGLAERRTGAALRERPRSEFCLSTKVGRILEPHPAPTGSDLDVGGFAVPDDVRRREDYSRDGVRRSLEQSLIRLGLDHIDIAYVHDPERHMDTAVAEAVPALAELRDAGVIGAIGVGMNFVEPLERFVAETDVDLIMVAGRYTLLDRRGTDLLDQCLHRDVAVVAAAPFNSGVLAHSWPPHDAWFDYGPAEPMVLDRARALATACTSAGIELPHAALQFPLRHPAVISVVSGMRNPGHVASATRWISSPIEAGIWSALAQV